MNKLNKGEYFGQHKKVISFNSMIVTDTIYTCDKVDWHYHENPYFTYLLQGQLLESSKKQSHRIGAGGLLYHNSQDAHFNVKPPVFTRGFHLEILPEWFSKFDIDINLSGSLLVEHPLAKEQMNKIFFESKINDEHSEASIELMLMQLFLSFENKKTRASTANPNWVEQLKCLFVEAPQNCTSLTEIAAQLNIHPVHLSREFPKYFSTTLGNYIRQQKINKAVLLMLDDRFNMTEICYECDFYDQSHFTNNFKKAFGLSPLKFKKQLVQC